MLSRRYVLWSLSLIPITFIVLASFPVSDVKADDWILLGTDPNEGTLYNTKAVYYKIENGILYSKIGLYKGYSMWILDLHIRVGVDCNINTR